MKTFLHFKHNSFNVYQSENFFKMKVVDISEHFLWNADHCRGNHTCL